MAISLWSGSYLFMLVVNNESNGILGSKILHVGASFIPIFFYHFVLSFTLQKRDRKKLTFLMAGYILAVIFSLLSLTSLIVTGSSPKLGYLYWIDAGKLYPLLLAYFWIYALAAIYFLYQSYMQSSGILRKKIFYVLVASIIGFAGGGTSFLPQTLGIYPFGQFFVWLYPVIVTYGIFIKDR